MASPIRIPGPGEVSGVGIARDPGVRATAQQFGSGIGEAAAGLSETASSISQHLYQKRKAVEDLANVQRYELEDSTVAQKGYLNMQGQAGLDPDNFHDQVGATLQASWAENDKRLASEGARLSSEARKVVERRRGELLQNFTLKGVTDAHNARVVHLGQTLDTNLTQIGTGLATSGDIAGAERQAEQALTSMGSLVDPENLERARQATKTNLGKSVVSYLNTLQDEAVGAPAEEREFYVTQGHSLIDQAVSKGWIDPANGAEAKRQWEQDYQIRVIKSLQDDPQEIRRLLGDTAPPTSSGPLVDKIIGVESGGDATAKNSRSTATGAGQFIESTWKEFIADVHPDLLVHGSDIQKLRNDPNMSRQATQWYADKNAAELREAGLPVTDGTLYLSHFAGDAGAKALLTADPNASVESVLGAKKVRANPHLRGMTASDVVAWADKKMGDTTVSMSTHGGTQGEPDPFFASMPADVRMNQILAARADQGRLSDEYLSGVEDYGAFLRSGGTPDGRYTNEEVVYQLGPERGAEVAEGLTRAAEYGEKVNALRMASPAEVTAMLAQEKADLSSPEDFRVNAAEYAGVAKATQERNNAIAADPGGYVTEYDPRTKAAYEAMQAAPTSLSRVPGGPSVPVAPTVSAHNYATSTLAAQKKLGVPASMQSILPKTEVAAIAEQFTFQPDGGTNAAEVMQAQEAKWGKHWPKVFEQLVREGNLPGVAMVVGTLNRPGQEQAAKQLSQAANMGVEGLKKAIPDAASKAIDDAENGVEPLMAELRASLAFNGNSGVTTFNNFSESARLLSMYYVYQGDEPSNAMTRATNDIINKGYTFPDVNGKTIRVPIEQDEGTIQSAAERELESLDGMGLQLPEDDFGLDENQTREAYTNSVRANGFWVTSEDESGLTLHDGRGVPVLRTNGKPLTMTWQNLVSGQIVAEEANVAADKAIVEQGLVPPTVPGGLPTVPGDLPFGLGIE